MRDAGLTGQSELALNPPGEIAANLRPGTIVAALVIGATSMLSLGILPILLGGLVGIGRLTQAGLGRAAMFETFAIALGGAIGGYWMGRSAMRAKAACAALGLVLANVATAHAGSTEMVLFDRAVAGLLAGLLLGTANAVIVRARNPDRLSGIMFGLSMLPQIAAAYLIPVFVMPRLGVAGSFYIVAGAVLLAALSIGALIDRVTAEKRGDIAAAPRNPSLPVFVAAIILQSAGFGAAWFYLERLAHQHGFTPSAIGIAIAGSLAFQVAGSWISAWLSPKAPKWPSILVLSMIQISFTALAIITRSPAVFIAAVCIFGSVTPAMQPFQIAETIELDPTLRTAVQVGPMIFFGTGLGPALASFLVTQSDVEVGAWLAVAITAISALLYLIAAVRSGLACRRRVPPAEPACAE